MKFNELKNYIEGKGSPKMRMSHIYQPVMIKTLLESNNKASIDKIARRINDKDESNIALFRETVKKMPGKVLGNHGLVKFIEQKYELQIEKLDKNERKKLIELCDEKINEYEKKRTLKRIWDYKTNAGRHISGSLQFEVLEKAKRRCECCGANDRKLHVDHIQPVSRGGKTEIGNLQALCYRCNTQKGNRNETDFRIWEGKFDERDEECIFCKLESKSIDENLMAFTIRDKFPVTKGHTLIIPKRHVSSFFDMVPAERNHCYDLLDNQKTKLKKSDKTITGFNIGINDSYDAGQTIPHCHIHLIPRRSGDVINPRGGIRNIITGKGNY